MATFTGLNELRYSRVLFRQEHGSPMFFSASAVSSTMDGDTIKELENLIDRGGGVLITDTNKGPAKDTDTKVLNLCNDHDKDLIKEQGFIPISFIRRCIIKNHLVDPQDVRKQVIGVSSVNCSTVTESDNDLDLSFSVSSTDPLPVRSSAKSRKKFTDNEDFAMLAFIDEHNEYKRIRGKEMWRKMQNYKVTSHPAQSMQSRFLRIILPNIDNYKIPRSWKRRFERKRPWEDDDSDSEEERSNGGDDCQSSRHGGRNKVNTSPWLSKKNKKEPSSVDLKLNSESPKSKRGQTTLFSPLSKIAATTTRGALNDTINESTIINIESSVEPDLHTSIEEMQIQPDTDTMIERMQNQSNLNTTIDETQNPFIFTTHQDHRSPKKYSTIIKYFHPSDSLSIRCLKPFDEDPLRAAQKLAVNNSRIAELLISPSNNSSVSSYYTAQSSIAALEHSQGGSTIKSKVRPSGRPHGRCKDVVGRKMGGNVDVDFDHAGIHKKGNESPGLKSSQRKVGRPRRSAMPMVVQDSGGKETSSEDELGEVSQKRTEVDRTNFPSISREQDIDDGHAENQMKGNEGLHRKSSRRKVGRTERYSFSEVVQDIGPKKMSSEVEFSDVSHQKTVRDRDCDRDGVNFSHTENQTRENEGLHSKSCRRKMGRPERSAMPMVVQDISTKEKSSKGELGEVSQKRIVGDRTNLPSTSRECDMDGVDISHDEGSHLKSSPRKVGRPKRYQLPIMVDYSGSKESSSENGSGDVLQKRIVRDRTNLPTSRECDSDDDDSGHTDSQTKLKGQSKISSRTEEVINVINVDSPPVSRELHDQHADNDEPVSKEITKQRVYAMMKQFNLTVEEAVDKMIKGHDKFWKIVS